MIFGTAVVPIESGCLATTTWIFLLEVADMGNGAGLYVNTAECGPVRDRGGALDPLTCALLAIAVGGGVRGSRWRSRCRTTPRSCTAPPARVRSGRPPARRAGRRSPPCDGRLVTSSRPPPRARSKPVAPFDATDPTYPQGPWEQLDHAVRSARSAGASG